MDPRRVKIEVRSGTFGRVGQVDVDDVRKANFIKRFNQTGAWTLTIPVDAPMSANLKQPKWGVIVWLDNRVFLSGPMVSWTNDETQADPDGVVTFTGVDDMVCLADEQAYPTPVTADVTQQTTAYNSRSGALETVIKGYVNANIGPSAPAERRTSDLMVSRLVVEADQGRGGYTQASARFDVLGTMLSDLCEADGTLGFDVVQANGGSTMTFYCYTIQDRSGTVRMDIENDTLANNSSGISAPKTTVAVVAGQGQGDDRTFLQVTDSLSVAAQSAWGRRIVKFIDQRNTNDPTELQKSGTKEIEANGRTTVSLKVTPADSDTMQFGVDWGVGDVVGVVVDGQVLKDTVSEAVISIDQTGAKVGATVGDPVGYDWEAAVTQAITDQDDRLKALERNSENARYSTTSKSGLVELATGTEAAAGTSTTLAVTPAGASTVAANAIAGVNNFIDRGQTGGSSADWNNLLTMGSYNVNNGSGTPNGFPSGAYGYGTLVVLRGGGYTVTQLYFPDGYGYFYQRNVFNPPFTNNTTWRRVLTTDDLSSGQVGKGAQFWRSTNQGLSSGTAAEVGVDSTGFNDDTTYFTLNAGRVQVLKNGLYSINYYADVYANAAGNGYLGLMLGGDLANILQESGQYYAGGADLRPTGSIIHRLTANQTLSLRVSLNAAGTVQTGGGSKDTGIRIAYLGS